MLVGENGLIKQAGKAKEDTLNAQEGDEEKLSELEEKMNQIIEGKSTIEKLKEEGIFINGNTKIKDDKGNKIVIPDGFKIAIDSGINVSEGIVIEDDDLTIDGNGQLRGNQFVWIPVSNINQEGNNLITKTDGTKVEIILGRYNFGATGKEEVLQNAENYLEETLIPNYYQELVLARQSDGTNNTTAKNLKDFIDSVKINGGYYIARYEASYRNDGIRPYSKVSTTAVDSDIQIDGKLWNYITQSEAAQASRNMYTNSNFETDLINSFAWDTAISYIQKCSGDTNYAKQISLNNILANTGKNGDERCQINDLASNVMEWTTEYSTSINNLIASSCVFRGGGYFFPNYNVQLRSSTTAINKVPFISFRVVLYM